jgi:hypothetical protein
LLFQPFNGGCRGCRFCLQGVDLVFDHDLLCQAVFCQRLPHLILLNLNPALVDAGSARFT